MWRLVRFIRHLLRFSGNNYCQSVWGPWIACDMLSQTKQSEIKYWIIAFQFFLPWFMIRPTFLFATVWLARISLKDVEQFASVMVFAWSEKIKNISTRNKSTLIPCEEFAITITVVARYTNGNGIQLVLIRLVIVCSVLVGRVEVHYRCWCLCNRRGERCCYFQEPHSATNFTVITVSKFSLWIKLLLTTDVGSINLLGTIAETK